MPTRAVSVLGVVTFLAITGSARAIHAQGTAPSTSPAATVVRAVTEPPAAQPVPSSSAQPSGGPATRGRWGGAFGLMRLGGHGSFDYTNSATPSITTTGPYNGAVIDIDHVGPGFLLSGGYRGPLHAGGRVGFGIDAEFGGGGGHPADKTVTVPTPRGSVTFSTERGGIIDMVTAGAGGHVSYNVAPRLNVLAGVKVSSLRVKPGFGSYDGPRPPLPPGATTQTPILYLAQAGDRSPRFWRTAAAPFVGAELFFWKHGSIDLSASFQPEKTERLAATPWVFIFGRDRVWVVTSVRIFH